MLSFDVEEYFHVEAAAAAGLRPEDWDGWERRLDPAVGRVLELLAGRGATATFFVLGWVAREEPGVVERIARAGHEIASHGMTHAMLGRLGPERFAAELAESRRLLEDLSGRPVRGYRAPTFSVTAGTAWAIDCLAEAGYEYDSSVFPVRHDRYGVPDAPRGLHWAVGPGGGRIVEIPPLTLRMLGQNLPVGGGGYLRLLPTGAVARALRGRDEPGMVYLHPWELDPGQPPLPMSRLSRWRHRVNLHRTEAKLDRLLRRFPFAGAEEVLAGVDASTLPRHAYGC
jgi:polysaccharide deacetylase family protein (PEP-CTERM system associated)